VWNESNHFDPLKSPDHLSQTNQPQPALIASVENGSIAEELGFQAGDKILSINGQRPRDLIDYRYLIVDEELEIEIVDSYGETHRVVFEKEIDDGLGIVFSEALFDGLKQCNNKCPFCFIDQQPPGKRKTLYLKDDDYRLSFLYGSYLTLTNLTSVDWQRIEAQRLSPLYVSVHATNPFVREKLLKNSRARMLLEQLQWFASRNLQIHAQVVICPGLNDGNILQETLLDLAVFGKGETPAVLSVAVVPVGLTRFRPRGDELIPIDEISASRVIGQVERMQYKFLADFGSRFAWLADEWYLIAGKKLPLRSSYEDFPQQENGVGTIRSFLEQMNKATENLPENLSKSKACSWVVGKIVENALKPIAARFNAIDGLSFKFYGLPSKYWGQDQVVTGLLTGQDLIDGLKNLDLGNELLLPSVTLRKDENVFLDDVTLDQVSQELGISIRVVHGAADIVDLVLGESE